MEEEEIANEYKRENRKSLESILSKVGVGQLIIFFVIVAVIIAINSNPEMSAKYGWLMYIGLAVIILWLYFKPSVDKTEIPERKAKEIAQKTLNRKIREGIEIPFDSKCYVKNACYLERANHLLSDDNVAVVWHVGFDEHVHGSRFIKEGVVYIHPYSGKVMGINYFPLGYDGRQTKDKTYVPVGVFQGSVKTSDFGNKGQG